MYIYIEASFNSNPTRAALGVLERTNVNVAETPAPNLPPKAVPVANTQLHFADETRLTTLNDFLNYKKNRGEEKTKVEDSVVVLGYFTRSNLQ